jgi:hypothetical protein
MPPIIVAPSGALASTDGSWAIIDRHPTASIVAHNLPAFVLPLVAQLPEALQIVPDPVLGLLPAPSADSE